MAERTPTFYNDRFGVNLRIRRDDLGLTRQKVAKRSGVNLRTIVLIETGGGHPKRRPANLGEAILLAEALGTTVGDLIRGDQAAGGEPDA